MMRLLYFVWILICRWKDMTCSRSWAHATASQEFMVSTTLDGSGIRTVTTYDSLYHLFSPKRILSTSKASCYIKNSHHERDPPGYICADATTPSADMASFHWPQIPLRLKSSNLPCCDSLLNLLWYGIPIRAAIRS